jgi:hypothetical protein
MDDYELCSEKITELQRALDGFTSRYAKAEGDEHTGLVNATKELYWEVKPVLARLQKAAPAAASQVAEWAAVLIATETRLKALRISLEP